MLGFRCRVLGFGGRGTGFWRQGYWVSEVGYWILEAGVLGFGCRILGFGGRGIGVLSHLPRALCLSPTWRRIGCRSGKTEFPSHGTLHLLFHPHNEFQSGKSNFPYPPY